jgi:small-conductance mechanosensitive channel
MIETFFGTFLLNDLILSVAFVFGGLLLGLIFDRIILAYLKRLAAKTDWEGDDIIIHAVHGLATLWLTLGGIYFGILLLHPAAKVLKPVQHVLLFLLLFSGTVVAARIGAGLAGLYSRRAVGADRSISIFTYIAKLTIYIIGFLVILQSLGVSITPILTALGVGGLAVALALQDTLGNLFAGLSIIAVRKVRVGEYVRLDSGQEGYVADISWRYTEIRQLANNMVLVPNSKLAGAIVTNFSRPDREVGVMIELGVGFDSDLEQVERIAIDVAAEVMREVPGGIPGYQPSIRYSSVADSTIRFSVNLRGGEYVDQYLIKHEFIKRLQRRFRDEGIVIPVPAHTVLFANGKGEGALRTPHDER